ncbi:MAG: NUDIX hydrolase [Phycisphaerales bacterium]|nr:NUDIX hydrolase [Phycisphaerales bacterium]
MPLGHLLHRSPKFDVVRAQRRDPAGREHAHEIVVHPGAAVILPVLDDGRIVLIRNWRVAAGAELLELPAGTLEPGEAPSACAARELQEETGFRASRITPLTRFFSSPGICTEVLHLFAATGLSAGPQSLDAGESIRVEPTPMEDALAAVRNGQIMDAKSIAGILFYDRWRTAAGDGAPTA